MRWLWLGLVVLGLMGCAARSGRVSFGSGSTFELGRPGVGASTALVQSFSISRGGKPFLFNAHVELEPDRLALVGLTPVGSRGFSAVWSPTGYVEERLPFYRLPVPAPELLGVWQLAFLPEFDLASRLEAAGLTLTNSATGRTISSQAGPLLEIERAGEVWPAKVVVRHLRRGYSVIIQTHSAEQY